MIVKLRLEDGDEGYDKAQRQIRKRLPKRGARVVVEAAIHAPIAHILGLPCIAFLPRPKWAYPLVHERNVITILVHESVHCAIQRRLPEREHNAAQQWFDRMFPEISDSRVLSPR